MTLSQRLYKTSIPVKTFDTKKEIEKAVKATVEKRPKPIPTVPTTKPIQGPKTPVGWTQPAQPKEKPIYDPTRGPIVSGPPQLEALAKKFLGSATLGLTDILPGQLQKQRTQQLEAEAAKMPVASTAASIAGYIPTGIVATGAKVVKPLVETSTKAVGKQLLKTGIGTKAVERLGYEGIKQATEGAIVGTGMTVAEDILRGKPKEIPKDVLVGAAFGVGADIGLNQLAKVAKPLLTKIRSGNALTQAEKQLVATQANVPLEQVDTLIQRELGLPESTTAQDFMRQQEQVAKDIEVDNYYKQFETPSQTDLKAPTRIVKPLDDITVAKQQTNVTDQLQIPKVQQIKSIAENIEQPVTERLVIPLVEPSEKIANVLTELPTKRNIPIGEKLAKGYQMFVSSDLPLERIGRQNEKVSNLASTLRSVGGSVDYNLETAMTDIEGNAVGKSLFSVFKDVPEENKKDLFEYALHKHNLNRYEQGKPVFGESVDTTESNKRLLELSINPQLEEKSKEITEYMNGLMNNWALKSGLVNEDTIKTLNELYPNYVPTYRNKEGARQIVGGSKGNVSNVVKKAEGGSSDILPLDQQMAMLTNKVIRASRKNELYNSLYDTFESNPDFAKRWFKPITKESTNLSEGIDGIASTFEEPIKKVGDTYELNFFRNGEKVKAEISKDLYDAIKPMNELTNIEEVAAVIKKYGTNPFKSLITTYNPIFVVRNIMRDLPTAFLYSNDAVEWSKNMPKAFKEIVSNGDAWKEYRALGGARSGIFSYDKPTDIKFKGKGDNLLVKGAKGVVDGVQTMNNLTETLPRFAEYLATVKKGGGTYDSKLEGIMRASEITTDFGRGGKATKFADSFVPYLNPSVQGIDKFARQAVRHPLKTALKGGLTISTPTLILDYINKGNKDYQELSEREKNQYYLIPQENGNFIRIPKSRETGVVFSTMLDWVLRRSRGEEVKPSEIASTIKENFTPVNMVENNLVAPLYKSLQQIKDPSRDVKNYAGISIVPAALKKYEPKEQYDAYTSEVAKQIGQVANISPKVVDYLIRSYSGILGQTLMPKTSPTQRGLLESSFITDPVFKSGNVNKFYDELEKQTQELAKQKREDEKTVDPRLKRFVKNLNAVSREISDLRKEQKEVDSLNISNEEKKKRIREIQLKMNVLTSKALKKSGN